MSYLAQQAEVVARNYLASSLPRRWQHVRAVATKAAVVGPRLTDDIEVLVAAAWVHDIGYAPEIVSTGFHSLDGARWLLAQGFSLRLASLVANHSCALYEAEERGMSEALRSEFPLEESPTADALWYADMTTGPDGQDMAPHERLAEIRQRYGPNHLVTRFWQKAEPALMLAVQRTQARFADHPM
ncbi:HD domain-containing protein [Micromonospora sp. DT47]|uniref:HD domain-containing protein n=1 Tax=Micromonospora sp. DT47 TaxID=3393431 RepID=UPI003CEE0895